MTDLVILVGGKGKRLGLITKLVPKPLIKIKNKPFLDLLLYKLIKYNFKKIFLLCSYKKEKFIKIYHNKKIHNSKIICIDEGSPKDTGGSLNSVKKKINESFFLMNGDSFFNFDFNLLSNIKLNNSIGVMAITDNFEYEKNSKINNLTIDKSNYINFSRYKTNLMNGGIYYFKKDLFKHIPKKRISLENEIMKKLILKKKIKGVHCKNLFIDIGTKNKLKYLKNNSILLKNKVAFLDRDGVINKLNPNGYIQNFNQLKILSGVAEGIKFLNKKGYLVIVVTNQACVGKSIISEKKLNQIHHQMKLFLQKKNGARIDDIYYAPYYKFAKNRKYRLNLFDRKPNKGMFLKAIDKWNINIEKSFFIGDQPSDYSAAKKVGINFYYKKNITLINQLKKICN
jgi:D,D-heptose 1,7-bisphosphate phosphatase